MHHSLFQILGVPYGKVCRDRVTTMNLLTDFDKTKMKECYKSRKMNWNTVVTRTIFTYTIRFATSASMDFFLIYHQT